MTAQSSLRPVADREIPSSVGRNDAYASGVSWAAVAGGAFVAAALSLILLSLGTGLGFSAVSPWSNNGASAAAIGSGAIGVAHPYSGSGFCSRRVSGRPTANKMGWGSH